MTTDKYEIEKQNEPIHSHFHTFGGVAVCCNPSRVLHFTCPCLLSPLFHNRIVGLIFSRLIWLHVYTILQSLHINTQT